MSQQAINENDIQAFVQAIGGFFESLSQTQSLNIQTAFLAEQDQEVNISDFTGVIKVAGRFKGSIWFSAPRPMLRKVLMYLNEPALTDENFMDAAGEIANIFAGNARRHFGESLEISPPELHMGLPTMNASHRARPFVIVVSWERYKAYLIVDVARA